MKVQKIFYQLFFFLLVCAIVGFIIANTLAKPIFLTDEEIRYYTNTAEKAWGEGLSAIKEYEEIDVESNLNKHEVHIIPLNKNKQSITVNFSSTPHKITINKPVVSYWGVLIFYGLYFGFFTYAILYILSKVIKNMIHTCYQKIKHTSA